MALSGDLQPKLEKMNRFRKSPLMNLDVEHDDLKECTSDKFKKVFMDAQKVDTAQGKEFYS